MPHCILHTPADLAAEDIRSLYDNFNTPVAALDCGKKCSPHNPSGKPFCCDICYAVPAAYTSEWDYLSGTTDLWHRYQGDECASKAGLEPAGSITDEKSTSWHDSARLPGPKPLSAPEPGSQLPCLPSGKDAFPCYTATDALTWSVPSVSACGVWSLRSFQSMVLVLQDFP